MLLSGRVPVQKTGSSFVLSFLVMTIWNRASLKTVSGIRVVLRSGFTVLLLISISSGLCGQTQRIDELTWWQYKGRIGLAEKWSLTLDLQHRRQEYVGRSGQQVFRPGLTRHLKNGLNLTTGVALFWHNIATSEATYRFEVRPYTFLEWKQPLGRVSVTHRSRFELRYNRKTSGEEILDGYNFNYRAGHKMGIKVPLQKGDESQWFMELYDEVLLNFGKRITNNYLDQNRMYLGFKNELSRKTGLKIGYMYIFVPTSSVDRVVKQHVIVAGISQSF